ncbi:MAG TPA: SIMPL domain-containing protein, partial [Bacteroidota bacterium]
IKKMDDAGKILDQAVKNGATGFGPLQYESSKRRELEYEALARAAEDARVKAELLARQLGATLGRVMTVSESGVNYPSPIVPMRMKSEMSSMDVPVMAGEMEISASVEIVFELK